MSHTEQEIITIPDRLKLWKECLEEGDIKAALEHHDAVCDHILKHQDSARIFSLAGMTPDLFIHWNGVKEEIREQVFKSPEQRQMDYDEAVLQLSDLAQKIAEAGETREVLALMPKFQPTLQQLTLNAACLDDARIAKIEKDLEEAKEDLAKIEAEQAAPKYDSGVEYSPETEDDKKAAQELEEKLSKKKAPRKKRAKKGTA